MKKNLLKGLAVAAFAMIAGYNVYQAHSETEGMSELMLANVEAIANGEYAVLKWNRHDYTLDNGTPAVNCWNGGIKDCLLK